MKRILLLLALLVAPCGVVFGWNAVAGSDVSKMQIDSIDKIVFFTDEQKQSIATILDDRAREVADFNKQNAEKLKAASEKMAAVMRSGDKDALSKAQEDYNAVSAPL